MFWNRKKQVMKALVNKNGITIKELKELVKDLPEQDENGEDFKLLVMNTETNAYYEQLYYKT
jgi:hypothetical protein